MGGQADGWLVRVVRAKVGEKRNLWEGEDWLRVLTSGSGAVFQSVSLVPMRNSRTTQSTLAEYYAIKKWEVKDNSMEDLKPRAYNLNLYITLDKVLCKHPCKRLRIHCFMDIPCSVYSFSSEQTSSGLHFLLVMKILCIKFCPSPKY